MPKTNKELILDAIAQERQQFLDKLAEILTAKASISDADRDEILSAVGGIVDNAPPAPGKANFSAGFIASGEEYFAVSLVNNNITPERVLLLNGIIESGNAAGAAQAPGGASFNSTVYRDDGSGRKEVKYDNAKQKAASDVAILTPLLAEAQAQLSA